jgi:tRNA U54 and U55 pseudouridine synthase Pus10
MATLSVRVTDKQKKKVNDKGGSLYVRELINGDEGDPTQSKLDSIMDLLRRVLDALQGKDNEAS